MRFFADQQWTAGRAGWQVAFIFVDIDITVRIFFCVK